MIIMRMLRWMFGVTKKDKIRNDHVRGSVKVAPVTKKITEKMGKWYRHVKRREEGYGLGRMVDAPVQERDEEEDRKPVGKTLEKRYGKYGVKIKGGA